MTLAASSADPSSLSRMDSLGVNPLLLGFAFRGRRLAGARLTIQSHFIDEKRDIVYAPSRLTRQIVWPDREMVCLAFGHDAVRGFPFGSIRAAVDVQVVFRVREHAAVLP